MRLHFTTMISLVVVSSLLISCGKKGGGNNDPSPAAAINNVSQERTIGSSVFHFSVSLDKATTKAVTIHFATVAGTAVANTDFTPVSGTLTIPASQLTASIDVTVTGDSLRKDDQTFFVQLDNPQNCTLQTDKGTGTIVNKNGLYFPVANTGYSTPTTYPGYTLAWGDEFDGNALSTSNWSFEIGNNNGWGNNELEYYTDRTENAFVSAGNLIIEARNESFGGKNYTSTRMITKNKKFFKFGRIDIRAKLPKGKGIWPALWMLGSNIDAVSWPACGEMDILEMLGHEPNKIYGTMHWGNTLASHGSKGNSYTLGSGSFDQQFHVYSLIWKQDDIRVLVDDQEYVHVTSADVAGSNYPFNSNFFFIFNIAVGGSWPGSPDGTTVFPQRMVVDYVRVFQ
ncbi:MAG: glycosyl hydrolase family protein [Bacteroidetes bacterium]|jgi:beta-glucanase (GH16 family)|nr:MAG: glycosyl hydrolase family protein [Bacteroidota bacterium]